MPPNTAIIDHAPDHVQRDADGVPVRWRVLPADVVTLDQDGARYALRLDAEAIAGIATRGRGKPIPVDCDHALYLAAATAGLEEGDPALQPIAGERLSCGHVILSAEPEGLWATVEHWTERAKLLLKAGAYRYFSPVIRGLQDGRLRVTSLALTNRPALDGLQPLVASADLLVLSSDPITPCVAKAMQGKPITPCVAKAMQGKQPITPCVAKAMQGKPITQKQTGGYPMNPKLAAALAIILSVSADALALSADGALPEDIITKLEAHAAELPVLRTAATEAATVRDVLSLSADSDSAVVEGKLRALTASASDVVALSAQLAEIKAEQTNAKRLALIERGKAEGKLTKAQVDGWAGKADIAVLSAYLETAPVVAPVSRTKPDTLVANADATNSAIDTVARACGLDPEAVRKTKV